MKLEYVRLSDDQVRDAMAGLTDWEVRDGQLTRTFSFETYKDGVVFASAVGFLADKLNHHPDLTVGYGKVTVAVNTHDVGGLSPYDFELARRIDVLSL
jgi:4a-hydroxytetrahydrobiopterin dehydratase